MVARRTGRSNLTMKGKMADIQAQIKQAKSGTPKSSGEPSNMGIV
jgi:hypothetical protein